jgi:PAS domain S-box-containing protein
MGKSKNFITQNFHYLDMMPVGAFIVNQNYNILFWNSCLARWSGVSKESILGTHLLERFPNLKQPQYSLRLEEVIKGGPPAVFSSKFHKYLIPCPIGRGKYQTHQTTVTAIHDGEEQSDYALFTIQDVTDATHQLENFKTIKENLLKKEIDLETVILEAKRINNELEQFAHVVSHDLKAPLRGIQNLADWILATLKDKVTEESKVHLQLLKERTLRMQVMIDAILNYSKNIGGRQELEMVDSRVLIKEIIEEIEPLSSFHFHINPKMPQLLTHRTRLKQVFANLIGNAVKHHNREDGTVDIEFKDTDDAYEFIVKDDGPGIDSHYQKNIFALFQTGTKKLNEDNTGIGLAIAKKIVKDNKGSIELESSPESGTQFRFIWPKISQPLNLPQQ